MAHGYSRLAAIGWQYHPVLRLGTLTMFVVFPADWILRSLRGSGRDGDGRTLWVMKAGGVPMRYGVAQAASAAQQYDNIELRPGVFVGVIRVCSCKRLLQFSRRVRAVIPAVCPRQLTLGHYK